jgi:RNA polymerase sigma-70 factor, ECF subfamily
MVTSFRLSGGSRDEGSVEPSGPVASLIDVDDQTLLRRLAERQDEEAFRALYARHTPAVYGLLSRLTGRTADASDVMQETWLRAVRHLPLFRGQSAFRTWLTGIALNCYREWRRRHAREAPLADVHAMVATSGSDDAALVAKTLARLAFEHREAIVLHDIEGYTHEEIAEALEIEPGTSKSRLSRARKAFREHWQGRTP